MRRVATGKYYLLTIAIDKYPIGIGNCEGAVNGADQLQSVLTRRFGFEACAGPLKPLRNAAATKDAILDALDNLSMGNRNSPIHPDDSLIVYLAGEGANGEHENDKRRHSDPGFTPVDFEHGREHRIVNFDEIQRKFARIEARHILLICDFCYSGEAAQNSRLSTNENFQVAMTMKSRKVMTSGGMEPTDDLCDPEAPEFERMSTFARAIIDTLERHDRPRLRASQLYSSAYAIINEKTGQTPIYREFLNCGDEPEGELVLSLKNEEYSSQNRSLSYLLSEKKIETFDNLVRERTKHFIGRDFLTQNVLERCAKIDSGIVFVSADPGFGKTSWAAELCRRYGFHRHFADGSQRHSSPEFIKENLARQVLSEISLEESQKERVDWGQGLWSGMCSIFSNSSMNKTILVLDGIDELSEQTRRLNSSLLLYLFDEPIPPNIVIIAVSRRDNDIVLPVDSEKIDLRSDTEENYRDVLEYFKTHVHSTLVEEFLEANSISIADLHERLTENSQGNFMYAQLIVPHLIGRSCNYSYATLDEIPDGLERFYEEHWRKMKVFYGDAWFSIKLPVLVELSMNDIPISIEQILRNTGLNDRHGVRKVLTEWAAFLKSVPKSESEYGVTQYSIYHKSFSDFVGSLDMVEDERINLKERRHKRVLINYDDILEALSNAKK